MNKNMTKFIKFSILAIFLVAGFSLINGLPAQALTIADQNGIPSACPSKSPNNYNNCGVFINNINVNGFNDNDTSESVRYVPIEGNYITPGQTITIQWNYYITSFNPSPDYFLVKYGCGNTIGLSNDDYIIANNVLLNNQTNSQTVQWLVPISVTNYQYCKIWVYAKSNAQVGIYSTPTVGVSNTRAFTTQPQSCVINSFTSNDYDINSGDNVTLTWNTSNCNSCNASASPSNSYWTSSQATYGSKTIYNLTNTINFTLACNGSNNSDSKNITVNVNPPPIRYSCNTSTYQCYQTISGTYANYNDCVTNCQPPIIRYTCNSNYQCVVATNGEYSSYSNCLSGCVAPIRYNCNTSNWTCYQATNGTYGNYNDCANACQTNIQPLSVSCYASPNPSQVNQLVTFYSNVSGGSGSYTYSWSNYASGNNSSYQTSFGYAGTYTAYLTVYDSYGRSGSTTCSATVYGYSQSVTTPTLSFWADNYTLNQGETTYLRWTSNNANYCVASNGWSGTKATSNYESTAPTSQTTYTLTCYGNGGQVSQTLTIYVASPITSMSFTKLGRNLSNGDSTYAKVIHVSQGDVIEFYLTITAGSNNDLNNVVITDPLPSVFSYMAGTTKINGVVQADTIATTGLSLGTISRGTSKTITFQALSNNPGTYLTYTNTAQATASGINAVSDSATITYGLVAGAATVATGAEDSLVISIMLSIGLAILLWYYLKFNPQGKIVLARLENKVREYRLEYLRHRMKK